MPLKTISKDDGYVRPEKTYTEALNPAIIAHQLAEYKHLANKDFTDVHLGSNIKYFVKKDGMYLFRLGGTLANKSAWDTDGYVVLMSAYGKKWCVQLKDAVIFVKMSNIERKKLLENKIKKREEHLIKIKEAGYKLETQKTSISHNLLENKQFLKQLMLKLSERGKENMKSGKVKFVDTQKILPFGVVIGYNIKTKQLTQEIEVSGTEMYKNMVIGLRYVDGLETKILPTGPYHFLTVGSHKQQFDDLLNSKKINVTLLK